MKTNKEEPNCHISQYLCPLHQTPPLIHCDRCNILSKCNERNMHYNILTEKTRLTLTQPESKLAVNAEENTLRFGALTCAGAPCTATSKGAAYGCLRRTAGDSGGSYCCHRFRERSGEPANPRGKVRRSRAKQPKLVSRLLPKLLQSGAQTSSMSPLLLQEMFARSFEEFGPGRADKLPGGRCETMWVRIGLRCIQVQ